jgi:hypothetical protein
LPLHQFPSVLFFGGAVRGLDSHPLLVRQKAFNDEEFQTATGVKLECAKTHGLVPFAGLVAKFGIEHTPIDLLHPFPADEMEAF